MPPVPLPSQFLRRSRKMGTIPTWICHSEDPLDDEVEEDCQYDSDTDVGDGDDEKEVDRLWKVRPLLDIRNACLTLPRSPDICVDKQIIPFTSKCSVKQFVPGKPNPTGLKNFILASPQSLVLDFEIFQGKGSLARNKHGIGAAVVLKLAVTLPHRSSLYFDRYFTGVPLLESLAEMNLKGNGTVMKSWLPKGLKLKDDR
ncbi:hypothetical protein HPB50_020842 [Hyalomma asiaticum]|uniref:Uncharacterized protein n=1 Tax=Hyalomma asiaticum TaxID=266040 RepID=A0ACB7RZ06_HYAAI|nr:hypothetical protein HPB50_020842 [Hyalomma asiaticum]